MRELNYGGKTYTRGEPGDLHDVCIVAVHKESGKMFGGKKKGTHIGYSKIGYLKTAMTNAGIMDKSAYRFEQFSFDKNGVPTFTTLEENKDE